MSEPVTSDERAAENEARFRAANDEIASAAADPAMAMPRVPFICECDDPRCNLILRLTLDDYRAVRRHPRRFFVAPNHDAGEEVVDERGDFVVVEKRGRAGEVAEELAP